MSVSTINDSRLDLPNELEVQHNQTTFQAAMPYLTEYLTECVINSALAAAAFKLNYLRTGAIYSVTSGYAGIACVYTIIAAKSSSNALQFNEIINPMIAKVYRTYFASSVAAIVAFW